MCVVVVVRRLLFVVDCCRVLVVVRWLLCGCLCVCVLFCVASWFVFDVARCSLFVARCPSCVAFAGCSLCVAVRCCLFAVVRRCRLSFVV